MTRNGGRSIADAGWPLMRKTQPGASGALSGAPSYDGLESNQATAGVEVDPGAILGVAGVSVTRAEEVRSMA
jgi:hypothetical protein